jgi:hypothetical protein
MKTRSKIRKSLALVAMVVSLVVSASVWRAGRVAAIGNPDIQPVEFGLISLAPGQTARLNAVSLGGPDTIGDPDDSRARRVRLAFDIYAISDPNDSPNPTTPDDTTSRLNKLRLLRRVSRDVTLRPGEAASFNFTAAAGGTQISAMMIGDVEDTPNPIESRGPQPHIVPTLEVMEGGRTIFTHPALVKFFNPQPDPPGGL